MVRTLRSRAAVRSTDPPGTAGSASARPRRLLLSLLPPLLALLAYANTLGHGFTLDDLEIVARNPLVEAGLDRAGEIFRTPYWGDGPGRDRALYRPVTIASYALQRAVAGPGPASFHLVNVLLHALAAWLVARSARAVGAGEAAATLAGVLFAVHPVHVEAVAGIVGRAEVLALCGILGGTLAGLRAMDPRTPGPRALAWGAASVVACLGGALAKEGGLVAPAVLGLAEWLRSGPVAPRRRLGLGGTWLAAALLVLALRSGVVEGRSVNEAFAGVTTSARVGTALRILVEDVGMLVAPVRLSAEWRPPQVPLEAGWLAPGPLAGVALLVGLVAAAWLVRRRRPAIAWGLGAFLVTLLPVSNLLFPIGVLKAERLLYAPSAGFLVAVAAAAVPAFAAPRRRGPGLAVAAVAVLLLGAGTVTRNPVWRDNCALATATLRTAPGSPVFLTMAARCRLESGDPDAARALLDRALAASPGFPTAELVYGELERGAGRWDAALARFESVLAREPRHVAALDNAAWLAYRLERWDLAAARYERWREIEPGKPAPWIGAIASRAQAGRLDDAARLASEALRRFPDDPDVVKNARTVRAALEAAQRR